MSKSWGGPNDHNALLADGNPPAPRLCVNCRQAVQREEGTGELVHSYTGLYGCPPSTVDKIGECVATLAPPSRYIRSGHPSRVVNLKG